MECDLCDAFDLLMIAIEKLEGLGTSPCCLNFINHKPQSFPTIWEYWERKICFVCIRGHRGDKISLCKMYNAHTAPLEILWEGANAQVSFAECLPQLLATHRSGRLGPCRRSVFLRLKAGSSMFSLNVLWIGAPAEVLQKAGEGPLDKAVFVAGSTKLVLALGSCDQLVCNYSFKDALDAL